MIKELELEADLVSLNLAYYRRKLRLLVSLVLSDISRGCILQTPPS